MSVKRVMITGGAGFVGSNLVRRCIAEGFDVLVADDLSNGHVEFLPKEYLTLKKADFSSQKILSDIKKNKVDFVVHLAALPRVSYSVEHPLETHEVNVNKTLQLFNACCGNVERVVFASSSSVYGGADELPTPETAPVNPKSPYAHQKSVGEYYLRFFSETRGLEGVSLRFFNIFGPNQVANLSPYACAVSSWLSSIKGNRKLRSDGTGEQSRDLCYVDNVTDAIVKAIKCPFKLNATAINIACGDRITNNEILGYLKQRYQLSDDQITNAPWRAGDVMHTQADITKAFKLLGYKPLVRALDGIEKTCDWYDLNQGWISKLEQKL